MVTPDVVAVYADGMMNLKSELESMSKTEMKSFSLTDFNVVIPDADTAIITYKADVRAPQMAKIIPAITTVARFGT